MKNILFLANLVFTFTLCAQDKPFITWFNPPRSPQPFLTHHSHESAAMTTKVGYNLYLPPAYDAPGNTTVARWTHRHSLLSCMV